MEENKIPPKNTWHELGVSQLYDVKYQMMETYNKMRSINASFANQYSGFISELDALILKKMAEQDSDQN